MNDFNVDVNSLDNRMIGHISFILAQRRVFKTHEVLVGGFDSN